MIIKDFYSGAGSSAMLLGLLLTVLSLHYSAIGLAAEDEREPWTAPPSSKELKSPLPAKDLKRSTARGKKLFETRCVVCHGESGKGDGPGSKALQPKPADLSSDRVQGQSDGEIFWKISEGRPPMVTWKLILSENERWDLVNFVRSLKSGE